MSQDLVVKLVGLVGFFVLVPLLLVYGPWPGVYSQDRFKVLVLLIGGGLMGVFWVTLLAIASRRPMTMEERKRARAALRAEWVGRRPERMEMSPLTPEDLRPTPDFDPYPSDFELPPRPPAGTKVRLGFGSLWRNFQPQEDREAYEREIRRWD